MFRGKSKFARHIDPDQALKKRRVAPNAFMARPDEKYLSVNAIDRESKKQIARTYRRIRQGGRGSVRLCIHTVYEYNRAAENTNGAVTYNHAAKLWEFADNGTTSPAYSYRPNDANKSHCGIEYVRVLNELDAFRVAVRLANKPFEIIR